VRSLIFHRLFGGDFDGFNGFDWHTADVVIAPRISTEFFHRKGAKDAEG
jgi:hypothetical protein